MALDIKATKSSEDEIEARIEAAVAAKVADIVPALLEKFAQAHPASSASANDPSFNALASGLAMAIAELNDQGAGRKRVSPEVVKTRTEARYRMETLIAEARMRGELPTYTLVNKVVFDEQLIEPMWVHQGTKEVRRTEIGWPGVPNENMRPLNEVARPIFEAFLESIGTSAPSAAPSFRVSANGVVYMDGRTPSRKPMPTVAEPDAYEGVRVMGRGEQAAEVRKQVLGTWAAPAVEVRFGPGGTSA